MVWGRCPKAEDTPRQLTWHLKMYAWKREISELGNQHFLGSMLVFEGCKWWFLTDFVFESSIDILGEMQVEYKNKLKSECQY